MEIQSGNGEEEMDEVGVEEEGEESGVSLTSCAASCCPGAPMTLREKPLVTGGGIEHFHIPLRDLKRMFEKPSSAPQSTEVRGGHPSAPKLGPSSLAQFDQSRDPSPVQHMASLQETPPIAGSTSTARSLPPEGGPVQRSRSTPPLEEQDPEPLSVKERLAMYQAVLSKKGASSSAPPAAALDDSETCSLPGGLASVKRQFESQQFTSSSSSSSHCQTTVTQHQYLQRSTQEVSSSSETTVRSRSGEVNPTTTLSYNEEVIHDQKDRVAATFGSHYNETVTLVGGEDLPKVSTQTLKQQYEKTIEEASPSKHEVKIDVDFNQFQWAPVNHHTQKSSDMTSYQSSCAAAASSSASASSATYEPKDLFPPPPPPDLPQVPQESCKDCTSRRPHDQPPEPRQSVKEQYFQQKSMAELKRLYKHIHPEVRKNLEADFLSQLTEEERARFESEEKVEGEVQQTCYMFENDGGSPSRGSSPEGDYLEWEEILKGEVQSMRWMFENKPLDTIKDDSPDESEDKNIAQQEIIAGKDVRYTAWMFETQPMDALGTETPDSNEQSEKLKELARGDVRTATWLFETQPLDYMNKMYQEEEQALEVVVDKDITGGDVKTARYLFETQHLDSLGKTETIAESHFLNLKSELEEIKGEVRTTTCLFETQPMCVIRGDSGEMLEITKVRREETEKGDVKTSRWMFETQPLDMINQDPSKVKLICGVSMEEDTQGGVNKGKWLFETKTLDSIRDDEWESSKKQKEEIIGADVRKHCLVFETQPMDMLKDNANARPLASEEIVGGDVRSAKHLFETVPMEDLKDLPKVGKLQKTVAAEDERGDVRHQRWMFESQPLENIREEKREITRTVNIEALDKGDVTNYKERFETMDLSKCEGTHKIQVEGVTSGSVKSNKVLFEATPAYAMQDSAGHYHEVKTVRREEVVKGDVRSCRWMFETRPIDEFDESINKFQLIKGVSKQEIQSGDVKTAKWLFETQALDAIKYEDEERKAREDVEIEKGDVKTCRWLFETQPMDVLYEKEEKSGADVQQVQKGDVKTCTWLFETQTLDNIRDHAETESETVLKTCTVKQEDVHGKDVRLARYLFETEKLDHLTGEDAASFRRVTEIDIHSGDVSRMKYVFENRSSDIMSSTSEETMTRLKSQQAEDIQKGDVINCTRKFETQAIDTINQDDGGTRETHTVTDVQGGNVDKGRFIFETYSLDEIQQESTETGISKLTNLISEEIQKGDVKNYTMMFETQPLYAIRDKDGHYHEVTTVTKEEIMRGDVKGARWQFETKPLDSIRDSEEVYVIKAVTEEGVNKGDVSSARWRFETQPLDEIAEDIKVRSKTVEDVQGGDVKTNKQRFEADEMSPKYVRTVSVSEIQKGDVRSATWMFETRTIDKIHSEAAEYDGMETVTKEEVMKGDVKQSVWLFEKEPLDKIKENDEAASVVAKEEIPRADVKSTTWLFESTPFHEFNESSAEKTEITGKSIKETLQELYCQKMVDSQGILIEADEIGDVRMAKYRLMNQEAPEIQKEDIIRGDLNNIMMNLLNRRETTEKAITIDTEERGNINTTVRQLFNQERGIDVEKEEIIRGDIQEAINNLLKQEGSSKRGILIQEDEKGDVRMTIYSLLNKEESDDQGREDVVHGNVSRTLHRLLSNPDAEESKRIKVGDTERGNVSFYSTCIESGALDYLRQLQYEPEDDVPEKAAKERIIGGDVEETKLILRRNQQQIGRTVAEEDIVPGDVNSTVKVFMAEPSVSYRNLEKEDIVRGDLLAALDSLTQAANQRVVIEKEEVVKGDLTTTLKSLEEAQYQAKEMEKPDIIRGDIRGALESLEKSASAKTEATVEDLVPGDIKGTLESLEEAKKAVKEVEKEEIVKGDIYTAMQSLHEASNEKKLFQHQVSEQGDVRGTIQLLLEPTTSPRMQRRGSIEGDVRTSIKTLYEGQETTQVEKEEVVRGDVQGAIKCLMQKKQYTNPKRMYSSKRARVPVKNPSHSKQAERECSHVAKSASVTVVATPAVANLPQSGESQRRTQTHAESRSVKAEALIEEERSFSVTKTGNTAKAFQQTRIKEESGTQKKTPPQPKTLPAEPVAGQNKQVTKSEQAEIKAVVDTEVKEMQNVSQTNVSIKTTQEVKTIKRVQTTVVDHKATTQRQNVSASVHASASQKQSAGAENKNLTQKLTVKGARGEYRNLEYKGKGGMQKRKPEIHFPPPPSSPPPSSESEFSLPPPPSPVTENPGPPDSRPLIMRQDSDLPPPPPPPPPSVDNLKSEADFFLPPPPPPPPASAAGPDFLPPPPSQQELGAPPLPHSAKPGKPIGRPLFKVPKPQEPARQPVQVKPKWQKKPAPPTPPPPPSQPAPPVPPTPPPPPSQPASPTPLPPSSQPAPPPPPFQPAPPVPKKPAAAQRAAETTVQEVKKETIKHTEIKRQIQTQATAASATAASTTSTPSGLPVVKTTEKETPRPPKKFVPPIKLPPPPEPTEAPKPKPYARKFKTPLMLAEERFRQQRLEKEEMERVNAASSASPAIPASPATPASPPAQASSPAELFTAEKHQKEAGSESTQSTQSTKAEVEENKSFTREEKTAQQTFAKKLPSHVPSSKPSLSPLNKKAAPASAHIPSDKKQASAERSALVSLETTQASSDVVGKSQTAAASGSAATSSHMASEIKIQSGSGVGTTSVAEQKRCVNKSSSTSTSVTTIHTSVQENITRQSMSEVTLKAEQAKNINAADTQGGNNTLSQPTKIPKVAPSFKVKTFRLPAEMKEEDGGSAGQKPAVVSEKNEKNQTKVIQESSQLTSVRNEIQAEVKVKVAKQPAHASPAVRPKRKESECPVKNQTAGRENEDKQAVPIHLTPVTDTSSSTLQGQGQLSVSHSHQSTKTERSHTQEVIVTESVSQQSYRRKEAAHTGKQQMKTPQHRQTSETNKVEAVAGKSKTERSEALTTSGEAITRKDEALISEDGADLNKCKLLQLLSQIKELQGTPSKIDSNAFRMMISGVPDWMMGVDEKRNLNQMAAQQSKKKLKEMVLYVRSIAEAKLSSMEVNLTATEQQGREAASVPPPPPPPKPEMKLFGGPSAKTSKSSVGSSKVEEERKASHQSKLQQEVVRTPSPSFITIESVRRSDPPHGVSPSPPPYRAVGTPSPPPLRKAYTPTPHLSRATPSPTLSRSEKILQLKEYTAKNAQDNTPPPPPPPKPVPQPLVELAAEREEPSPVCHMGSDLESHTETGNQGLVDVAEMVDSMHTVRDKKSFFEEAQRAEVNKMYIRKDPIDIPERLGPDTEEVPESAAFPDLPRVDLSKLVNRFESPQPPPVYVRKDPIVITERLGSDTEDADADPKTPKMEQDVLSLNVKALKDVFETGEHGSQAARELREHIERRESECGYSEHLAPSETTSAPEHSPRQDDAGHQARAVRIQAAGAARSECCATRGSPPSYADVVRGKADFLPEGAADEVLRNYQQSWAESQEVIHNVGYTVTEQRTSQIKIRIPESELCTVCRTRVYPMESLIADKQNFHKNCFRCDHCRGKLSLGNYASLHGRMYCRPHFKQLFKAKGNYDEGFGQTPHKELWKAKPQPNSNDMKSPSPEKKVADSKSLTARSSVTSIKTEASVVHDGGLNEPVDETKKPSSKISVVWPPQTDSPMKSFNVEEELKLVRPTWPPQEGSTHKAEDQSQTVGPPLKETHNPTAGSENGHQKSTRSTVDKNKEGEGLSELVKDTDVPVNLTPTQETQHSRSGSEDEMRAQAEKDRPEVGEEDGGGDGGVEGGVQVTGRDERESGKGDEKVEMMEHSGRSGSAAVEKERRQEETEKATDDSVKGDEERVATDGGEIAGRATNANDNNNNNNSGRQLDHDNVFEGHYRRETKELLPFTEEGFLEEGFLTDDRFSEEPEWTPHHVLRIAERDDAFVPGPATYAEATGGDSDPIVFKEGAEESFPSGGKEEGQSPTGPKLSTSSFLEDIFAGLSTTGSSLLADFESDILFSHSAGGTGPASALDDLLDFGRKWEDTADKAGDAWGKGDAVSSSATSGTSLWADQDDHLTAEEQIKRNRYYGDSDDNDNL